MKRLLFILCVVFSIAGCKDKDEVQTDVVTTKYVNEWVYGIMDQVYYWNTTLPTYKSTDMDPNDYFETLKNKDDRFSAIFDNYQEISNELRGISSSEIGFDFQLYLESRTNDNVYGLIKYVKHGTPAEKLGIKRGDIFRKINGEQINTSNYSALINTFFDNSPTVSVIFSTYQNSIFTDKAASVIAKVSNYMENPVYLDTVYNVQNKKVGYIVYNFFTNDPDDKSMKYDLELNRVIGEFKMQNVSELIVDLRYNHGGMMSSAINFASMLVPNLTSNKVFNYTDFNQNLMDYFKSKEYTSKNVGDPLVDFFATTIDASYPTKSNTPIQNIGNNLQRIFFLTSDGTASASEMVINGLKPYLPCVLIGDTTVGKNVGSMLVYDEENPKNQWAFMPIILRYFNKDRRSDFTKGFAPDFYTEDNGFYELGDTREVLLGKAISRIAGVEQVKSKAPRLQGTVFKSAIDFKIVRNVCLVDKKSINIYKIHKK